MSNPYKLIFEKQKFQIVWKPYLERSLGKYETVDSVFSGYLTGNSFPTYFLEINDLDDTRLRILLFINKAKVKQQKWQETIDKSILVDSKEYSIEEADPSRLISSIKSDFAINIKPLNNLLYDKYRKKEGGKQKALDQIHENIEEENFEFEEFGDHIPLAAVLDRFYKKAQSWNSFYQEDLPDPKTLKSYIGGSSVDVSRIMGSAGGTVVSKSIALVNQLRPDILRNIAMIFDFSNQSAFGVYVPDLDSAIKEESVKDALRSEGIQVEETPDGGFTAYHPDMEIEEIHQKTKAYREQLQSQGGSVFGLNTSKTMQEAQRQINSQEGNLNPEDYEDVLSLHLAATIVHEGTHAFGYHDESQPEQAEEAFFHQALQVINNERSGMGKNPLMLFDNSSQQSIIPGFDQSAPQPMEQVAMVKTAQFGAQFLESNPTQTTPGSTIAPWAAIFWDNGGPLENMLGMAGRDTIDPNVSLEKRLRDRFDNQEIHRIATDEHLEEALETERDSITGYKALESLLDERRTKPLAFSFEKTASSKMIKTAKAGSAFGWMNNLDLPMQERVQTEDVDDWLTFDWKAIRNQFRYNPPDDGYKWSEPRAAGVAELWTNMVARRPFIGHATRASNKYKMIKIAEGRNIAPDVLEVNAILCVLARALHFIQTNKFLGTRVIVSENLIECLESTFRKVPDVRTEVMAPIDSNLYPVWIVNESVPDDQLEIAENFASKRVRDDISEKIYDHITGASEIRKEVYLALIEKALDVAKKCHCENFEIGGDFPSAIAGKRRAYDLTELSFLCDSTKNAMRLGQALAKELEIDSILFNDTGDSIMWEWMGINCSFQKDMSEKSLKDQ